MVYLIKNFGSSTSLLILQRTRTKILCFASVVVCSEWIHLCFVARAQCAHAIHDDQEDEDLFCVEPLWHEPVNTPRDRLTGEVFSGGHHFMHEHPPDCHMFVKLLSVSGSASV